MRSSRGHLQDVSIDPVDGRTEPPTSSSEEGCSGVLWEGLIRASLEDVTRQSKCSEG